MDPTTHRRDFVRTLGLGTVAGLLSGPTALADDEPAKPKDAPKPPAPPTDVDARMEMVIARFGSHLDDNARKAVQSELQGIVRRAETLRKFELTNFDGPLPVFHVYRAPLS